MFAPPPLVTDKKLAAGSTNAIRNEHVLPVSPNANATLGTYRERHSAAVMETTATTVARRLATSGGTEVSSPPEVLGFTGVPTIPPPLRTGGTISGKSAKYASLADFCSGRRIVGTDAKITSP